MKRDEAVILVTVNPDESFAAEVWKNKPECYCARGLKNLTKIISSIIIFLRLARKFFV